MTVLQKASKVSVWLASLIGGSIVGFYAAISIDPFISDKIGAQNGVRTQGIEAGLAEILFGLVLIASSMLPKAIRGRFLGALICGIGFGFIAWGAFLFMYFKFAPSC